MENHTTFAKKMFNTLFSVDSNLKIKIHNISDSHVQVNNYHIKKINQEWIVGDFNHKFTYRKSAVGFAICKIQNNYKLSEEIADLDRRIASLGTNIKYFKFSHQQTDDFHKKLILETRISQAEPLREMLYDRLMEKLKSIKFV